MTRAVFGSAESTMESWRLTLDSPTEITTATRIEEVLPLLEFAEQRARSGSHVALMLSYEAAPAFDTSLVTHQQISFPLAWAAVFPAASEFGIERRLDYDSTPWTTKVTKSEYEAAVTKIRELIAAGDTYQVNYSFPLTSSCSGDSYAWFRDLCLAQGSHYCAYLDLGRYHVLSLSPELFFERRGSHVTTRPMKGTVRRGRWPAEDDDLAQWLRNSAKDRAENVMIVDLLRNDLGKVSVPGSVSVSSLFELERFETVWQMTSTVESTLREGTRLVELMGALFPCGSVTGAPKIRTMEIIRELERFPRNSYTGAIGFLRPGGDCIFNVAIRTVVVDTTTNRAICGVGGGVTSGSTAAQEYQECLVKSRFLTTKPSDFELFESILLEEGQYFLQAPHLERLKSSASYFGFAFSEKEIKSTLDRIAAERPSGSWKIKVTLAKDGHVETEVSRIASGVPETRRVALSTQAVESSHRLLFHKTTSREFYATQLELRPDCDDVIFWNERGKITESSIANVVVSLNGELITPPIDAGLLAGTFRNQLLAEGVIKERAITIEELLNSEQLFLINSVRKWMRATLIETAAAAR